MLRGGFWRVVMAKRDPVKTIKALIIQELREDNPSFTSIDLQMKALKDALARQNRLGIDDVAPGVRPEVETRRDHLVLGTSGNITATGSTSYIVTTDTANSTNPGNEMMSADTYRALHGNTGSVGSSNRRRESREDQFLAACDQITSEARTKGTLGALAPVLHHLPLLYPNEAMQEAVREAFRQEINRVLRPVFPPIGPNGRALPEPGNGQLALPGTVEEQTEAEECCEEPREEGEIL